MKEQELTHKPHVGSKPVSPEPNHVREKTYEAPNQPEAVEDEKKKLPEAETREKTAQEIGEATDKVKERL